MTKYDCCVIGAGRFGSSLAHHLDQHGLNVIATHHDPHYLDDLSTATTTNNAEATQSSTVTCLTVRPEQVQQALHELKNPTTLINYTPTTFTEYNPMHVASTPPTNDTLPYVGFDDEQATDEDRQNFHQSIGQTAERVEHVDDHTAALARMTQVYATILTYLDNLALTPIQQEAFLDLTNDAVQSPSSIDDLLNHAATKQGFTAKTLDSTAAITEPQQKQAKKLKEAYNDIRT